MICLFRSVGCLSALLTALLLLSCTTEPSAQLTADEFSEIERSIIEASYADADEAAALLARFDREGNLLDEQHDYLRAIVLAVGRHEPDSAMSICYNIVKDELWRDYKDETMAQQQQVKVYELMAMLAITLDNPVIAMQSATRAVELTHGRPSMRVTESKMLTIKGYMLELMGNSREAVRAMLDAQSLVAGGSTWEEQSAYLNASANLATAYLKQRDYPKVEDVLLHELALVDLLDAAPAQQFDEVQPSLLRSTDYRSLLREHRRACYGYMFHILAYTDPAESKVWLAKLDKMDEGYADVDYRLDIMVRALSVLNMCGRAHEIMDNITLKIGADTLTSTYADVLKLRGWVLMQEGKHKEALNWMMRHSDLTEMLNARNYERRYDLISASYNLYQERSQREKVEEQNERLTRLLFHSGWIIALAAVLCMIYYSYKNHLKVKQLYVSTREQLTDAKEQLDEANEAINDLRAEVTETDQAAKSSEPNTKSVHERVYQRLEEIMERDKPYLLSSFDIQKLADMVGTNRTYVSSSVNVVKGVNFPTWVSSYRIDYAKSLFKANPRIKIEEVCVQSGFDTMRTFYRQFQKLEGVTPGQYVEGLI